MSWAPVAGGFWARVRLEDTSGGVDAGVCVPPSLGEAEADEGSPFMTQQCRKPEREIKRK